MPLTLPLYTTVSSRHLVLDVIHPGRSLLKMRNNNGPGTVPLMHTAHYLRPLWSADVEPSSMTCCDRSVRKAFIHPWAAHRMPLNSNLLIIKRWCGTISKTSEKYRTIKSCLPLSMDFASSRTKVTSCVSQLRLPCWQAVSMLWLSDDFTCCWFKHFAIYIEVC